MGSEPVYRCWVKGTRRASNEKDRAGRWMTSRRAWLEVHADRVVCGDWVVPFADVDRAILHRGRTLLFPFTVLDLRTADAVLQFGMNPWVRIEPHLPLELEHKEMHLRFSAIGWILRILLLAYVMYVVWSWIQ